MGRGVAPEKEFRRAVDGGSYERETVVTSLHDGLAEIEHIAFGIFDGAPQMVGCDGSPHVGSTLLYSVDALFRTHVLEYLRVAGDVRA